MRHPLAVAPSAPTSRRRRAWTAMRAVPVAVLAASFALATPALAHDALIGSDPADGAVLEAAPAQVVLTFAAPQAGLGSEVLVAGTDGRVWSDGAAQVLDATVTQALLTGMPSGDYTVTWRSVAGDGHTVSGTLAFTVTADAEPADPPAESPAPEPTDEPTSEPTDEPTSEPTSEPTETVTAGATAPEDPADPTTSGVGPWALAAACVVATGAAAALVVRRRRSAS